MPRQDELFSQGTDIMNEEDVFDIARDLVNDGMYFPIQAVAEYMEENSALRASNPERFWGGLAYDLFQAVVPMAEEDGVVYNESPVTNEASIQREVKGLFQVAANSI